MFLCVGVNALVSDVHMEKRTPGCACACFICRSFIRCYILLFPPIVMLTCTSFLENTFVNAHLAWRGRNAFSHFSFLCLDYNPGDLNPRVLLIFSPFIFITSLFIRALLV